MHIRRFHFLKWGLKNIILKTCCNYEVYKSSKLKDNQKNTLTKLMSQPFPNDAIIYDN